ncbi:hypothetical protein [Bacillus sp. FJAT-29814]|uniref:hypothetical protein n=1 Tax=Bacillus sp. FJAT-29814 TaxID=1729688 RepID=UPI00082AB07B|nr:hypothetical protein [Bacillus sp. FJAT-29814]
MELKKVVLLRNSLAEKEKKIYLNIMTQMNTNMKELLSTNIGTQLVTSCARDISGQVVRKYFDMGDLYITVDQLAKRITSFDYKDEYDPLQGNTEYQKEVMNYNDDLEFSSTLKNINKRNADATKKVFEGPRNKNEPYYDKTGKKYSSRSDYKYGEINADSDFMNDDLTGHSERKETIQGDHVRAVKDASYNSNYLDQAYVEEIKKIYNSEDNMQWINERANQSKGTAANVEETIKKWENASPDTKKVLLDKGYINEDGKVPKQVKKELERNYRHIGNVESMTALKYTNYKKVGGDAVLETTMSMGKIMTGQLIYYALPPLVYEVKTILGNGSVALESFFHEIKKAGKRIIKYVSSKLKHILANFAGNSIKKLLKTFFDILLTIVKDTIKRIMNLVKDLVLALVDSVKILFDKNATPAQKADSIFNLMSVTIANTVVIILMEYLEKQFSIPSFLVEAIEMLAIVLTTNLVMLILQKADLFNVRYGFMMANIEKIFVETSHKYDSAIATLETETNTEIDSILNQVADEIATMEERFMLMNLYSDSVKEDLENINRIFNMKIDFDKEWEKYIGIAN